MSDDCLFCKIIAGEIPADKVYENDYVFAFRDINPAAPTHVLIVPKEHIAMLSDLSESDVTSMGHIVIASKMIAEQEGLTDGFRLVSNNGANAGQAVFHIHFHMLGGRRMTWPPG